LEEIRNPILPGFHPDPSMIRVGEDYYIAVSSFEWFPGVPIYHSRDLVHWELKRNVLDTVEQLDLTGLKPSWGVWAPNLSYCEQEKRFYLVYSIVHNNNPWFFDVDNYVVTASSIEGEWSGPYYLNSSGFDPALFHDDDGRKWVVNKDRDFRPANLDNRAIVVQELDTARMRLTGSPTVVSRGATRRGFVEGAQIYKREGWYYLITAEGGTGYAHCVALSRSRSVTGPYEPCPFGPALTSIGGDLAGSEKADLFMRPDLYNPETSIQKAGHGSLVETPNGEWYMAHLCGRPVMPGMHCILGRETSLQRMEWTEDGWLRVYGGGVIAQESAPAPALPAHPFPAESPLEDFDSPVLNPHLYAPRGPIDAGWADLETEPGRLRLRGRESLTSTYAVSLLARKLDSFHTRTTAKLEFQPELYHHLAGISCYYASQDHYCAYKTFDETLGGAVLKVHGFTGGAFKEYGKPVPLAAEAPVFLRVETENDKLSFFYSLDGERFEPLAEGLDLTPLSDEGCSCGVFTGTFVGLFAQDSHTREKWASFDFLRYERLD
jgi:xylan 1,4-beta-xylosidase